MYENEVNVMRISAKGRYALASVIHMAKEYQKDEPITLISISEKLGISKIYLEQVFALLKRGGLVTSVKGAQGGYLLTPMPRKVTAYDVLSAVENSLFESTENTVAQQAPHIDSAMYMLVFKALDAAAREALLKTTLEDLVLESEKLKGENGFMLNI
jgi:Rrf2 family protein